MKAIVANVLFGGIFGCLSYANSTRANPVPAPSLDAGQIISSRLSSTKVTTITPRFNSNLSLKRYHQQFQYNISVSANRIQPNNYPAQQTSFTNNCLSFFCNSDPIGKGLLSVADRPYVHKSRGSKLQLGFQPTFWAGTSKRKYWGVTTIGHWGNDSDPISSPQLDYINSAPTLGSGSSLLTFSGGGDRNLAQPLALNQENTTGELEQFRGGIAYHHGFFSQLTMGVGVVYEDNLAGFTQLTYDSDILPLKTTVSLLSKESDVEIRSHLRLQPAQNFVLNFHSDSQQQKFDANWAIYPGLNIIAKANSKNRRYSTGFKVALQNNYFSLKASATIDSEQNLQWNLDSQIGRFKFSHNSDRQKSNSEVSNPIVNLTNLGFGCSTFVRYQTQQTKNGQQEFVVWGGRINSQAKVSPNKHQWSIDLGYGNSDRQKGLIANGSVALKPDLFLKLNYQEISAVSDRTNIKLQLSSN